MKRPLKPPIVSVCPYLSKCEIPTSGHGTWLVILEKPSAANTLRVRTSGLPPELVGCYDLKSATAELAMAWFQYTCSELIRMARDYY